MTLTHAPVVRSTHSTLANATETTEGPYAVSENAPQSQKLLIILVVLLAIALIALLLLVFRLICKRKWKLFWLNRRQKKLEKWSDDSDSPPASAFDTIELRDRVVLRKKHTGRKRKTRSKRKSPIMDIEAGATIEKIMSIDPSSILAEESSQEIELFP